MRILKLIKNYLKFGSLAYHADYIHAKKQGTLEYKKQPSRSVVINHLISILNRPTHYLEIGVRNPNDNFNLIKSDVKYSVDPGIEYPENPVTFRTTSDVFFEKLAKNEVLSAELKFDVIFIDGLHLADQAFKDITNAMHILEEDGFLVIHDCNPPTSWHARENHDHNVSPAGGDWNGTTWKAFLNWRFNPTVNSCCIDSDWGIGIISKKWPLGKSIPASNIFYEYEAFARQRSHYLNLISFDKLKEVLK